jgi:hypothetical protein
MPPRVTMEDNGLRKTVNHSENCRKVNVSSWWSTSILTERSHNQSLRSDTYVYWYIYIPCETNYQLVRFEVFTAVTMKNVVFWDIKTQFVLHRGHITSPLQSPAG